MNNFKDLATLLALKHAEMLKMKSRMPALNKKERAIVRESLRKGKNGNPNHDGAW